MKLYMVDGQCDQSRKAVIERFTVEEHYYTCINFKDAPTNVEDSMIYQYDIIFQRHLQNTKKMYDLGVPIFWNRTHVYELAYSLGEANEDKVKSKLWNFEKALFKEIPMRDIIYIYLTGVNNAKDIDTQIEMMSKFKEASNNSLIKQKIEFDVNCSPTTIYEKSIDRIKRFSVLDV